MSPIEETIIQKLNQQKGELIGMHSLLLAILRSLPPTQLQTAISELDAELRIARDALSYSTTPDDVIVGLEAFVAAMNQIRVSPNRE